REVEGAPASLACRLGPDAPAVRLDDGAADGEAQSGATDRARTVGVDAVEALEDLPELLRRDAQPLVAHADQDLTALLADVQAHRAAIRRVLQRVVQQVEQHLPQPQTVAVNGRQPRGDCR